MLNVPFDVLPNNGRVRLADALAVTSIGRSSYYVLAAKGLVPPVEKISGSRTSVIRVGELRRYLANPDGYTAPRAEGEVTHAVAA